MWLTFPFLQISFQFTDIKSLLDKRTPGASLYGATAFEKLTVVLGKLAHYSLLWAVPIWLHGVAAVVPASMMYIFVQGVVLAATFAVSHNIPETKTLYPGAEESAVAVWRSGSCHYSLLTARNHTALNSKVRAGTCFAAVLLALLMCISVQPAVLAATFAVSHNIPETETVCAS
jgi:hypothetical protein